MSETRDFPTEVIASISTGILLCKFSEMSEAAEYLMGHPIWTHHFTDKQLCADMRRAIAGQCPGMPMRGDSVTKAVTKAINRENYLEYVAKIRADLGNTVKIRKGSGLTAMLPLDGIPDHLKNSVFTIEVDKPTENDDND